METPNLLLPYLMPSQAQKHVTHNEALRALDMLVQLAVTGRDVTAPPAGAAEGARFIVGAEAAGEFAGHEGEIAAFTDGAWAFHAPQPGFLAFCVAEQAFLWWDGEAWAGLGQSLAAGLDRLGINAEADAANRLAVRSPASLFDHEGAGHRIKLNKASAGDTASLVFQTAYGGRGEVGLAGDDALRIKVSPDGAAWKEVLRADPATGDAILNGMRVSRDMQANLLPDSGRFNGNGANGLFAGIEYAAPTYLSPTDGALSPHAKFVFDNSDHGGAGATLDPHVKALVEKIRPPELRRYGQEWYAARLDVGAALPEEIAAGGGAFGLALTNSFTAMPARYTVGYYVKVLQGAARIAADHALVLRASLDGAPVSGPVVLRDQDGWTHVGLEQAPNGFGYNYRFLQLLAAPGSSLLLAMPKILFGHVELDPAAGVIMNARMFE